MNMYSYVYGIIICLPIMIVNVVSRKKKSPPETLSGSRNRSFIVLVQLASGMGDMLQRLQEYLLHMRILQRIINGLAHLAAFDDS